jgi:hypothetical protein
MIDIVNSRSPPIWSGHQTVFFVEPAGMVFFIERDETDWEQYFFKSRSVHLNIKNSKTQKSQKLNLAHA